MVVPTPAAWSFVVPVGGGGGTRWIASTLVALAGGITRGRFSGFEKNANTRSIGNGTHCSNSRWLAMPLASAYLKRAGGSHLTSEKPSTNFAVQDLQPQNSQRIHPARKETYGFAGPGIGSIDGVGACVPITSPETTISTRRLSARPAAVLLSATGLALPSPTADT